MKKNVILYCSVMLLGMLFIQCNGRFHQSSSAEDSITYVNEPTPQEEARQKENKQAWEEAQKVRTDITDTTFLQLKRPMSDNAIAPYNYQTGYVEDRAYNQVIYMAAIERLRKKLQVKHGLLVCSIKKGKDAYIAEDMFAYIQDSVFGNWNKGIKDGMYKIVTDSIGYNIQPIPKK